MRVSLRLMTLGAFLAGSLVISFPLLVLAQTAPTTGSCSYQCRHADGTSAAPSRVQACASNSDCATDCSTFCPTLGTGTTCATTPAPSCVPVAAAPPAAAAPTPGPIQLGISIGGVNQVNNIGDYIARAYQYLITISIITAIVMVVYGGFRYLMGSAGAGNVSRGKEIIQDAIAGLLLVLMAYTLLQTVNPATLTLRLPDIPVVQPESNTLRYDQVAQSRARASCAVDANCRPNNQGVCFLHTDQTDAAAQIGGNCSDASLGGRCRCSGTGCRVDATDTNNGGRKTQECAQGLSCVIEIAGAASDNWLCQSPTILSVSDIEAERSAYNAQHAGEAPPLRHCRAGDECRDLFQANSACLIVGLTDTAGAQTESSWIGYCTRAPETPPGLPCKCAGLGCSVTSNTANNAGRRLTNCAAGLECALIRGTGEGTGQDNTSWSWQWRCHRPTSASSAPATPTP